MSVKALQLERLVDDLEIRRAAAKTPGQSRVAARYIKNGTVKFPRKGCEQLITQLVGLGIEKHDDLCDACVKFQRRCSAGAVSLCLWHHG
jgi:hypothetical protein